MLAAVPTDGPEEVEMVEDGSAGDEIILNILAQRRFPVAPGRCCRSAI